MALDLVKIETFYIACPKKKLVVRFAPILLGVESPNFQIMFIGMRSCAPGFGFNIRFV